MVRQVGGCRVWQQGFSLIEIMVVVVIIGIFVVLIVSWLMDCLDQVCVVVVCQDIVVLMQVLKLFKLDNGCYFSVEQGLQVLVKLLQGSGVLLVMLYLDCLLNDLWGYFYQYQVLGIYGDIDVFLLGVDSKFGGDVGNVDIGFWQL